jgi:hypothetical protein
MYIIQDVLVGDEVLSKQFVCHLEKCKGACCVEGDFGAPLDDEEVELMENFPASILDFIDDSGKEAINEHGPWQWFEQDDIRFKGTTLRKDGACAFVHTESNGIVACGIEKAYQAGVLDFKKPVSCHLYPLRYSEMPHSGFRALNYDEWNICNPACVLGESLKVPLADFLKEAIIRRFGVPFWEELKAASEHAEANKDRD